MEVGGSFYGRRWVVHGDRLEYQVVWKAAQSCPERTRWVFILDPSLGNPTAVDIGSFQGHLVYSEHYKMKSITVTQKMLLKRQLSHNLESAWVITHHL